MAGLNYWELFCNDVSWRYSRIYHFSPLRQVLQKRRVREWKKSILTFNDLPEVVAQLRDEVMSLKKPARRAAQCEQCQNGGHHVPMSVDEAAEYLGIPKGTLYMKLSEGTIPATKPGKRYCLYRDELDKWLETARKNPIPLSDEELNKSLSSSHRRKPNPRNW